MRVPDANLLLYAYNAESPHHEKASTWLEGQLSGTETTAFAWLPVLAFIRLATHPRVLDRPKPVEAVLDIVNAWFAQPCATIIHPTERHASILRELIVPLGTGGNITNDAHLAALAIEHGAELCSADTDFARFPGLRWTNPLASG